MCAVQPAQRTAGRAVRARPAAQKTRRRLRARVGREGARVSARRRRNARAHVNGTWCDSSATRTRAPGCARPASSYRLSGARCGSAASPMAAACARGSAAAGAPTRAAAPLLRWRQARLRARRAAESCNRHAATPRRNVRRSSSTRREADARPNLMPTSGRGSHKTRSFSFRHARLAAGRAPRCTPTRASSSCCRSG
jgi:hypothetical protein